MDSSVILMGIFWLAMSGLLISHDICKWGSIFLFNLKSLLHSLSLILFCKIGIKILFPHEIFSNKVQAYITLSGYPVPNIQP